MNVVPGAPTLAQPSTQDAGAIDLSKFIAPAAAPAAPVQQASAAPAQQVTLQSIASNAGIRTETPTASPTTPSSVETPPNDISQHPMYRALQERNNELLDRVAKIPAAPQTAPVQKEAPTPLIPFNMDVPEANAEHLAKLEELGYGPAIKHMIAAQMKETLSPYTDTLNNKLTEAFTGLSKLEQSQGAVREHATSTAAQAAIPGINNLLKDPKFNTFLSQPQGVTQKPLKTEFLAAYDSGDVETMQLIANAYGQNNQAAPAASAGRPNIQSSVGDYSPGQPINPMYQPTTSHVGPSVANVAAPGQTLDFAQFQNAQGRFAKGEISLEEMQNIQKLYEEAETHRLVS